MQDEKTDFSVDFSDDNEFIGFSRLADVGSI